MPGDRPPCDSCTLICDTHCSSCATASALPHLQEGSSGTGARRTCWGCGRPAAVGCALPTLQESEAVHPCSPNAPQPPARHSLGQKVVLIVRVNILHACVVEQRKCPRSVPEHPGCEPALAAHRPGGTGAGRAADAAPIVYLRSARAHGAGRRTTPFQPAQALSAQRPAFAASVLPPEQAATPVHPQAAAHSSNRAARRAILLRARRRVDAAVPPRRYWTLSTTMTPVSVPSKALARQIPWYMARCVGSKRVSAILRAGAALFWVHLSQ